jgi:hypothetical protein
LHDGAHAAGPDLNRYHDMSSALTQRSASLGHAYEIAHTGHRF